jgi:AhpC/TSA family
MRRMVGGILVLLLGLSVAAGQEAPARPATPAEQYEELAKEFREAANAFYLKATTDQDRIEPQERIVKLSPRCLGLAENHPRDPVALDALVQVVTQELWLHENTSHPGRGQDNLEARAIAILLRDHVQSDRLGEACRRMSYGFSKECETFLRTVLEKNPHRDVQALACLRLAQFLGGRLKKLDLLAGRSDMARRYEGLFGKDYVAALQRRDRAEAAKEAEAFFERAIDKYGDVKVPYGDTVAAKARSELHEIRHLSVGREAQEIEGPDQDGKRFKLSDYRGKVVLLYFWSEY